MFYSCRAKLITSFLGVSLLVGLVSVYIGSQLLYRRVLNEATNRISLNLNSARRIYQARVDTIATALTVASTDGEFHSSLKKNEIEKLTGKLSSIGKLAKLDFAGLTSSDGRVICRFGPIPLPREGEMSENPFVLYVLRQGKSISGTSVFSGNVLFSENPALTGRAVIPLIPTPMAAPREENEETSGMTIGAGIPLLDGNRTIGILYGGQLLNRSQEIVDTVRDTVFQNETYKGRNMGTATIFLKDARISTNVLFPDGSRAIGTLLSQSVRNYVLLNGNRWTDRAYVVSDWYITSYEPIMDIFGERVGILYVGVLEQKYIDMRKKAQTIFILITVTGMLVAVGMGYFLAHNFMKPIRTLITASREVLKGNLDPDIGPISKDEIGVLQKTFTEMLSSIRERDERQREECDIKLLQSEKQAAVGRLAAGVAHEINNPLTGVLTFTHMLLKRKDIDEEMRSDLTTIAKATERVRLIVKGLLDFSRQTVLETEPADINEITRSAIQLIENNALLKGVNLHFKPAERLPMRTVGRSQIQSVLLNILLNALDATESGGTITVTTTMGLSSGKTVKKGIEISVSDTGCGIPPANIERIFDPFFTTKEVGKGTGIGLSVSYGIIERHEGSIRVHSTVGKGSTFRIWLPLEVNDEE